MASIGQIDQNLARFACLQHFVAVKARHQPAVLLRRHETQWHAWNGERSHIKVGGGRHTGDNGDDTRVSVLAHRAVVKAMANDGERDGFANTIQKTAGQSCDQPDAELEVFDQIGFAMPLETIG